jgi:hypothetical protein
LTGTTPPSKEKERRAKKGKMDALYARRKRERQRIEVEVLRISKDKEKNCSLILTTRGWRQY